MITKLRITLTAFILCTIFFNSIFLDSCKCSNDINQERQIDNFSVNNELNGIVCSGEFIYTTININNECALIKYDFYGHFIWKKIIDSSIFAISNTSNKVSFNNYGNIIEYNNYIYLFGRLDIYISDYVTPYLDLFILKYDENGDLLWHVLWGNAATDENPIDMIIENESLFLIGSINYEPLILRFDLNGNEIWNASWHTNLSGYNKAITVINNSIYVMGLLQDYYPKYNTTIIFFSYDLDGNLLWNKTYSVDNDQLVASGLVGYDSTLLFSYGGLINYYIMKLDIQTQVIYNVSIEDSLYDGTKPFVMNEDYIYFISQYPDIYREYIKKIDINGNEIWNITLNYGAYIGVCDMLLFNNQILLAGNFNNSPILIFFDIDGNFINMKSLKTTPDNVSTEGTMVIYLTIATQSFYSNDEINVTLYIQNNGTSVLNNPCHCFNFVLNKSGTIIELFCPYNISNEIILPGSTFNITIDIREYSSDIDTWEAIGNLDAGNYSIYAVYGDMNNPWYNETDFPYNRSVSNVVHFEVSDTTTANSNWLVVFTLSTIMIVTVSAFILHRYKRRKHL